MPNVLIAEADRDLRDIYGRFLAWHGYRVETAGDGLECLEKLRRHAPDLLILDLSLPWGRGDGVLAVMREDPRLRAVPVVLTMAEFADWVPDDLAAPPVDKVLHKPFPLTAFLEVEPSTAFVSLELPHEIRRSELPFVRGA